MSVQRWAAFYLLVAALLVGAPALAQDRGFSLPQARDLVLPEFTDREVTALVTGLDATLTRTEPALPIDEARQAMWSFAYMGEQVGRIAANTGSV
jgi:hypothetical protein